MAEEIKEVADGIADQVLENVDTELTTTIRSSTNCINQDLSDKGSLLCIMFRTMEKLIYWRNPANSALVFGGTLLVLLALTYASLISVIAYVSLFTLTGTIAFRIYKNIVQAIQKTGNEHPFKEYLELDISMSQDRVQEISRITIAHLNAAIIELRRLFLVEDLVDSIKFGLLLWVLTYLGFWFNGMTLIIIAWTTSFTLPKVYEANQVQIDSKFAIIQKKIAEVTAKFKGAMSTGKKLEKIE